jgi:hypothetical protein
VSARRGTFDADMTAAQARAERTDPAAVADACSYEAEKIDADAMREIGFYPDPDIEPPF